MKVTAIVSLSSLILLASCGQNSENSGNKVNQVLKKDSVSSASPQSDSHNKLVRALVKDTANTLNYTDANGKRQGHWIITNKMRQLPGYADTAKVEEGDYQDNMKEGEWIEYNADGSVKSTTTYKDDKPVE